jgi:hypothetical protein
MRTTARQTRENRTITIDFHNEATYVKLLDAGKAFVECVLAFLLALGFQLTHKATCRGGGCLTRPSHYVRVRLGGVTIWRIQCTTCRAVLEFVVGCRWYTCARVDRGKAPLFSRDWRRNRDEILRVSASVYALQTAMNGAARFAMPMQGGCGIMRFDTSLPDMVWTCTAVARVVCQLPHGCWQTATKRTQCSHPRLHSMSCPTPKWEKRR